MRHICFLLLFFNCLFLKAQVLVLTFKDQKTNEPIPNVLCLLVSKKDTLRDFSTQIGSVGFHVNQLKEVAQLPRRPKTAAFGPQKRHQSIHFLPQTDTHTRNAGYYS